MVIRLGKTLNQALAEIGFSQKGGAHLEYVLWDSERRIPQDQKNRLSILVLGSLIPEIIPDVLNRVYPGRFGNFSGKTSANEDPAANFLWESYAGTMFYSQHSLSIKVSLIILER